MLQLGKRITVEICPDDPRSGSMIKLARNRQKPSLSSQGAKLLSRASPLISRGSTERGRGRVDASRTVPAVQLHSFKVSLRIIIGAQTEWALSSVLIRTESLLAPPLYLLQTPIPSTPILILTYWLTKHGSTSSSTLLQDSKKQPTKFSSSLSLPRFVFLSIAQPLFLFLPLSIRT